MNIIRPETPVCPRCGEVPQIWAGGGDCSTCRFWGEQFATPGGLFIQGHHYRVGVEPPGEMLAVDPKRYGSYGVGFHIRKADGTEVITHNLWQQGEIPPGLARPDNAAFVAVGDRVPKPQPSHRHTEHLHHYTSPQPISFPYECRFDDCGCWFLSVAEAAASDERAAVYCNPGGGR